jgi:hypothetical protein
MDRALVIQFITQFLAFFLAGPVTVVEFFYQRRRALLLVLSMPSRSPSTM